MPKTLLYLLVLLFFYSCKKEELPEKPLIIVEPPVNMILEQDSLFAGQFWGITIGESTEQVYAALQRIKTEKQITSAEVAGNYFTIADLDQKIPLYNSLYFDNLIPTEEGVQVYLADNKIKSIYLNNGKLLNRWPQAGSNAHTIRTGDAAADIYNKLVLASEQDNYKNRFGRIMLVSKNLSTPYDEHMSISTQWHVGSPVTNKKVYHLILKFNNGMLSSIHYTLILTL